MSFRALLARPQGRHVSPLCALAAAALLTACSGGTSSVPGVINGSDGAARLDLGLVIPDAVVDVVDASDAMDATDTGIDVVDVVDADTSDVPPCEASVCDASCVNLMSDPRNCGGCGMVCTSMAPNTVPTCVGGRCNPTLTCATDFADCDMNPANGCEVNLATSSENCGRCRNVCSAGPSSTAACVAGMCGAACATGFGNCDGDVTNGCEVDVRRDPNHCGMCGRVCTIGTGSANAHPGCADSLCVVACNAGFSNCDMNVTNGCETSTATDAMNCGMCGARCEAPNAAGTCTAGRCSFACNTGFADCDGNPANGCEVDTRTTPTSCGRCGNVCPGAPNAMPSCSAGSCTVQCAPGFGNCDGISTNGCETDVNTVTENCGRCGNVCPGYANGTPSCVVGNCRPACTMGFGNCDSNPANGCETDIRTSATNCGVCGRVCFVGAHSSAVCTAGLCGITCTAGFADCNNNPADGCEVDLSLPTSCGTCARSCTLPHATPGCSMGACTILSCETGFFDCDSNATNGCETAGGCPT